MAQFSTPISYLLLIFVYLLGNPTLLNAQNYKIDSLIEAYNTPDSLQKIEISVDLSEEYETLDIDKSWVYAKEVVKSSQKLNYKEGLGNGYFRYGRLFAKSSSNDSSLHYFTLAAEVFRDVSDSTMMAHSLHNIGVRNWFLSDYDNAVKAYKEAMRIWELLGEEERTAALLFNIALVYRYTQKPDSALQYIERSMMLREKSGNLVKVAKCLKTMGSIIFDKGEYERANEYLQKAISTGELLGDSAEIVSTYIELGRMDQIKGNVISAMENYSKALELSRRIPELALNRSVCYINIGEIHRVLRDYKGAYSNYKKSLAIRKSINNRDGVAACYLRLGQIKSYNQDYDSAAYYFKLSVNIYSSTGNINGIAVSKRNLGALYIEHGSLDSALIYLRESVKLLRSRSDEKGTTESELYMAIVWEKIGKKNEAISLLKKVFKWSADNEISDLARESAGSLATMLSDLGNYEEAYFYRTANKTYNDKLLSEKNIAQIALAEYKLEAEKKEQARKIEQIKVESELRDQFLSVRNTRNTFIFLAIMLLGISIFIFRTAVLRRRRNERLSEQKTDLNEKNQALQELSEELQSTLEDKDTLMKEVHHRVKNNLQVILSLLNAQLQNLSDELAINAIQDSQNRIKAMVLIHQNIYQSNEVSVVKSDKYIRDMIDSIYGSEPFKFKPELSINVEDINVNLNQAIPIGLIINELLTNSFKYAFKNDIGNKLWVSFNYDNETQNVVLVVRDNGIGLETKKKTPKGFGLDLVRGLTSQLNGDINVESEKGKGTVIEVVFKLAS